MSLAFSAGKYCDDANTKELQESRQDDDNTCVDVYETGQIFTELLKV